MKSIRVVSFTLGRLPQLQTNAITVEMPSIDSQEDVTPWRPYGSSSPHPPSAKSTVFYEVAALSKIVNSTLQIFFAPTKVMSANLVLDEYQKYTDWYRRLPVLVRETEGASPHVLCLQ